MRPWCGARRPWCKLVIGNPGAELANPGVVLQEVLVQWVARKS